jgi:hypothetical protein
MPRASGSVCQLVLATLSALAPGESLPTVELVRAISREGGDVRAALRDLRARSLVETLDVGTKRARHKLAAGAPRVLPASPRDATRGAPGDTGAPPASRGTLKENVKSSSLNVEHQRNGCCCCAASPGRSGELRSLALEIARFVLGWLENLVGRVSPENGASSCTNPSPSDPPPRAPSRSPSASESSGAPAVGPSPAPAGPSTSTSSSTGVASGVAASPLPRVETPRLPSKPHWSRERAIDRRIAEADDAVARGSKTWTTSRADWIAGMKKRITAREIDEANERADEDEAREAAKASAPPPEPLRRPYEPDPELEARAAVARIAEARVWEQARRSS